MEIYLDNAATTRISQAVLDKMNEAYLNVYGNPSAMHTKGMDAEMLIRRSREEIAKTLKASEKEIIFTSGGTESNNTALTGAAHAMKRRGRHIVTTAFEHASVLNPMRRLEEEGFEVTYVMPDESMSVCADAVIDAVRDDTVLVSVMHVNNETGAVMPVKDIGLRLKKMSGNIIFHVDAVQSYGKLDIYPKKYGIDLMSVSAHKFHGPKGAGFLYVRDGVRINPLILGGGQQNDMRSGTENVPGIAAMAKASCDIYENTDEKMSSLYEMRKSFINEINNIERCRVNDPADAAPHIVSVSVKGVRAEVLLHALEDRGIYISAGSACSSHKRAPSITLSSIGLDKELLDKTVRFSFSVNTTIEELDETIKALKEIIPVLSKYTRG